MKVSETAAEKWYSQKTVRVKGRLFSLCSPFFAVQKIGLEKSDLSTSLMISLLENSAYNERAKLTVKQKDGHNLLVTQQTLPSGITLTYYYYYCCVGNSSKVHSNFCFCVQSMSEIITSALKF